jgi:GNAT superfamily N-acetyltransferase
MPANITIRRVSGPAPEQYVGDLARLRIAVFREYPYLYDGHREFEEQYLRRYLETPGAVFVLAFDGERVVGVSTGCPLTAESEETRVVFASHGYAVEEVFYLGESVLLPEFRGQGLGHRFFDEREEHARTLGGCAWTAFCAVERDPGDPRRPADYRALDAFWQKRGYVKRPELRSSFTWREIGEAEESPKPMVFWLRRV